MNERKPAGINVGSATLLMIFAVLCLTIFAVLSLVTANSELRLAQRYADSVTLYYEAESQASGILDDLCSGEPVTDVQFTETEQGISYTVPMDETRMFYVELEERDGWQILQWAVTEDGEWNADESLSVWDGETENTEEGA